MSPAIGSSKIKVWSSDSWTSQILDVSMKQNPTANTWEYIKWKEFNTGDETIAYVRVSILNSGGTVLQSAIVAEDDPKVENGKVIWLATNYPNYIAQDLFIKFTLYGTIKSPIVKDIEMR